MLTLPPNAIECEEARAGAPSLRSASTGLYLRATNFSAKRSESASESEVIFVSELRRGQWREHFMYRGMAAPP